MLERNIRPILVTGTHRSGSTWVGKMLTISKSTYYLGEIFHPHDGRIDKTILNHWFLYIPSDSGAIHPMYNSLSEIIDLDFKWPNRSGIRKLLPSRLIAFRWSRKWFGIPRPIIKDPIAILASEWAARVFKMDVVGIIRHPAAFVVSLRKKKWSFPFTQLLDQTQLMEDHLYPLADLIKNPPNNFVEQGALAWLCLNTVLVKYIQRNSSWYIWRYEDICSEPLAAFNEIYSQVGLRMTPKIEKTIWDYSDTKNPIAENENNLIKRNSRGLRDSWRAMLSSNDVLSIRRLVEPVSNLYYSNSDW